MGMFQKIKAYLNEDDAEYDALIEEQERMRGERRKRRNQSRAERNKEKAKRAAEKGKSKRRYRRIESERPLAISVNS